MNPATFIHRGSGLPAIIIETPVISLSKWIRAIMPKMVPAILRARVFDFMVESFSATKMQTMQTMQTMRAMKAMEKEQMI